MVIQCVSPEQRVGVQASLLEAIHQHQDVAEMNGAQAGLIVGHGSSVEREGAGYALGLRLMAKMLRIDERQIGPTWPIFSPLF